MRRGAPVTQITKPQYVGAVRVQPTHETVMAKKKKRREKARAPQTPPLEELLRTGEAALYGQVCWSIANRGTDRPRPGEVITLDGGAEAGRSRGNTESSALPPGASRTSSSAWG